MYLKQIELRNKVTLEVIKNAKFEQINNLVSEDDSALVVFNTLLKLQNLALGSHTNFEDKICRLYFSAAHHNYLWFSKTDTKEGFTFDEEEFYIEDDMLLRRVDDDLTLYGVDNTPKINKTQSVFNILGTPNVTICRNAFENIYTYTVNNNETEVINQIKALPHGAVAFLNNTSATSLDLTNFIVRDDVQIFAVGFNYSKNLNVVKKAKAISIKN